MASRGDGILIRVPQVWDYEGAQTLGSFLRRRDCVRSLAADLGVPEADAVPTVMRQLLESLQVRASFSLHRILLCACVGLRPRAQECIPCQYVEAPWSEMSDLANVAGWIHVTVMLIITLLARSC